MAIYNFNINIQSKANGGFSGNIGSGDFAVGSVAELQAYLTAQLALPAPYITPQNVLDMATKLGITLAA